MEHYVDLGRLRPPFQSTSTCGSYQSHSNSFQAEQKNLTMMINDVDDTSSESDTSEEKLGVEIATASRN